MIYGYLRVSSDEQDVNSQRQGVEAFCKEHSWKIDKYITDEGVSGGKDPDKRNLGPLLKQVSMGDKIIQSAGIRIWSICRDRETDDPATHARGIAPENEDGRASWTPHWTGKQR